MKRLDKERIGKRVYVRRSQVKVLPKADIKTFADVGNFLTISVSAQLSKDSSFIHLRHTIQNQK